ncbi:MAG: hypothetical protein FJZ58_07575 [Chlamydiae bacterium]|nr:hypothetical protein [Chlamydiota bacterium]
MSKAEKYTDSKKTSETAATPAAVTMPVATTEDIRVTPSQFAEMLMQNPYFELSSDRKLVIFDMNVNDLLSAIEAPDHTQRLQILVQVMQRYSLDVILEGSIILGDFNIADHSWTLSAGATGFLKFQAKPSTVIKSLTEIVSFLNKMAPGKGFALKARQDLLLTGLSPDAMMDYYRLCQANEDPKVREKGQDELFAKACQTLALKNLSLKVYGLNAFQVDRSIDVNAGGILFKVTENQDGIQPHLILALLENEKNPA